MVTINFKSEKCLAVSFHDNYVTKKLYGPALAPSTNTPKHEIAPRSLEQNGHIHAIETTDLSSIQRDFCVL